MGENNTNNFYGETNFNGPTQIVAGNVINNIADSNEKKAKYSPEPLWRSPFTMAVLTWISVFFTIIELFPIINIVNYFMDIFRKQKLSDFSKVNLYIILFVIFLFLCIFFFSLRKVTKKQTRHPLIFNFAISGYGRRLTIEKIHIDKCPQCGGKMKYYNKPVEWRDIYYSDGKTKREVTRKIPVLECKRNEQHWYIVDPAEDMI